MPPVVQGAKWTGGTWFLNMSRKEVDSFGLLAAGLLAIRRPDLAARLLVLPQPGSSTHALLI